MLLERTLEDKKGHTGGHSSCEISNENHRLSAPVLGFYTEETSPLGFRENRRNWRRAGEVLTPLTKRCWLTNKQGRESPAPWLPPHRAAESKWGNTPALPTPHHILALDLEQTGPGRRLSPGTHRRLWGGRSGAGVGPQLQGRCYLSLHYRGSPDR